MSPGESRVGPQEAGGFGVVRWENALNVPRDKEFVDKKVPMPAGTGKLASTPVLGPRHYPIYNPPLLPGPHSFCISGMLSKGHNTVCVHRMIVLGVTVLSGLHFIITD